VLPLKREEIMEEVFRLLRDSFLYRTRPRICTHTRRGNADIPLVHQMSKRR
jgi:hypothetical protein